MKSDLDDVVRILLSSSLLMVLQGDTSKQPFTVPTTFDTTAHTSATYAPYRYRYYMIPAFSSSRCTQRACASFSSLLPLTYWIPSIIRPSFVPSGIILRSLGSCELELNILVSLDGAEPDLLELDDFVLLMLPVVERMLLREDLECMEVRLSTMLE